MARDPLASIGGIIGTPQTSPIPGREKDMVRNNAGGYTFRKDLWRKLEDFIILGTEGGTYYLGEDKLTADNAKTVFEAVKADGVRVVNLTTEISTARPPRAPKNRPALFVMAVAATQGDAATKQAVKENLAKVARTTDHLSTFFGYWKNLGDKKTGRAMRTAFGSWFLGDVDRVAWKALKARQRKTPQGEALALRDVLRIAHPKAETCEQEALFGWLAGNVPDEIARQRVQAIDDYLTAQAVKNPREAVKVIIDRKVPWEFLPDHVLTSSEVWSHLTGTIGMTALLRNLARMTTNGALKPFARATDNVIERLTDPEAVLRARIHPMDAYLALKVYGSGRAQPNPNAPVRIWTPVPAILDALEQTYELSFGAVQPSGRKTLIAIDSSGSMSGGWGGKIMVGGSDIGAPYEVANAMAIILSRIERYNAHIIDVDTSARPSRITPRTNLREVARWRPSGGATDMGAAFAFAEKERWEVDGFVIFTDNETWANNYRHPAQALESYRRRINPAARVVVASMTATGHTIGDPKDEGVLNMAGLDASLPMVVSSFLRG
jgi:60 kDa SS-A/Ro ribonucleoprotein